MSNIEIQDILDKVDIIDYISQYIDFEDLNGELFGLSPFTNEQTPSFSISPEKQLFYDFSSHTGGNVLSFIQKYNKCEFKEALNILKQYAKIDENYVDTRLNTTKVIKKYKQRNKKISNNVKHKILDENEIEKYDFDLDKLKLWIDDGISIDVLKQHNVRYDQVSNRIVFPVRNLDGKIISIKGRTLDPEFKAKKIRKYTYFQSIGDLDTIFGYSEHFNTYKYKKEIILFEGEKSEMICDTWKVNNTGSILTSKLNPYQLQILIKLGVRVVFALDKGIDIKEDENISKLSRFVCIEYISDKDNLLEPKMSPVDRGYDIFMKLYNERRRLN